MINYIFLNLNHFKLRLIHLILKQIPRVNLQKYYNSIKCNFIYLNLSIHYTDCDITFSEMRLKFLMLFLLFLGYKFNIKILQDIFHAIMLEFHFLNYHSLILQYSLFHSLVSQYRLLFHQPLIRHWQYLIDYSIEQFSPSFIIIILFYLF